MRLLALLLMLTSCAYPNMEPGIDVLGYCPTTEVTGIPRDHDQVRVARKICAKRGQCLSKYKVGPNHVYILCKEPE